MFVCIEQTIKLCSLFFIVGLPERTIPTLDASPISSISEPNVVVNLQRVTTLQKMYTLSSVNILYKDPFEQLKRERKKER